MVNPFKSSSPQARRLLKDLQEMEQLRAESTILSFTASGDPPDKYLLYFAGRGLHPDGGFTELHQVELSLGREYPRERPLIRWLTPIKHPNIHDGGVCLGTFTMSPYVRLVEIVEILWDMARMGVYNLSHAYRHSDSWLGVMKEAGGFPVDPRILRDRVGRPPPAPDTGEPDIFIMSGLQPPAGPKGPRDPQALKANIEFYLANHNLAFDSRVLTQEEWIARKEKFGNDALLTIVTEGPLYALLNRGDWPEAAGQLKALEEFLEEMGVYWDLGYAWSVHIYPTGRP